LYRIDNPLAGTWELKMMGIDVPSEGEDVAYEVSTQEETPPKVNIISPQDKAIVTGTVSVTAKASDDEAVTSFALAVDGDPIKGVSSNYALANKIVAAESPETTALAYSWDTTKYDDGIYQLAAFAVDPKFTFAFDRIQVIVGNSGPRGAIVSPWVSTKISKTPPLKVRWSATDVSGVDSYDVMFRPANSPEWSYWKQGTKATYGYFKGAAGRTYKFKVRAKDKAGHMGLWSKVRKTLVPYNEGAQIMRKSGFNGLYKNSRSRFYKGTVRYSVTKGNEIIYKFHGNIVRLISTRASNRSKEKIYIDGKWRKTIDTRSSKFKPRQIVFSALWDKPGTHYIKIVNLATPGRPRFDIDGLAVGR